jgi:integrase
MQKTQKWINVPLSDEALRWLPVKEDLDEPIFHLYDPVNIEKHIAIWMRNAKIDKHITYHCSRHTFATMMLTLDVDLYTVSKLLGHSKITTTQIYAKIIDKKRVDAVSKVDGIF